MVLKVNELFVSLQGEGPQTGQITTFIRLQGCNFFSAGGCSYCDTKYAQDPNGKCEELSIEEILERVADSPRICITGGEPLMQEKELLLLINALNFPKKRDIDIETNGSYSAVALIKSYFPSTLVVMDWKLPSSGMEGFMDAFNFLSLTENDVVKFVCGGEEDYIAALAVKGRLAHWEIFPKFYFHALGGTAEKWLVEAILEDKLWDVYFGVQLHKLLWGNKRGV